MKKAKIFAAFTLLCASLFAQKQDAYKKGDFYRPAPRNMVGRFGENYDSAKADRYKKLDTLDDLKETLRGTLWQAQKLASVV